ncbi:zinc finger protein 135-like [Phycodurus eques]|uniref:zinc finger protein 135-like n=1 Tax=Phycodurus eques TaxID=693459 RepID=UPI002ACED532|nr:zinc finger protein 135-like [Phycodurus eques]
MCKVDMLRALLNQRLGAAVEEIVVVLGRTIAEYEEELCRQRQLLDAVFKNPQIALQRENISEEDRYPEQQEWRSVVEQHVKEEELEPPHMSKEEEPQAPNIKEEVEEEEPSCINEDDNTRLPLAGVPVKNEAEGQSGKEDRILASPSRRDDITSHSTNTDDDEHSKGVVAQTRCQCSQCDDTFVSGSALKAHMVIHTGQELHILSARGQKFPKNAKIMTHASADTGAKPYVCSVCEKGFARKDFLLAHKRTHTGEKPYSCPICNACFGHRSGLFYHKRSHTGEKPYTCSVCNRAFIQKSSLTSHMRNHSQEKPFYCCNTAFCDQSSLSVHVTTHSLDKSSVLERTHASNSRKPINAHPGPKGFSCSSCEETFSRHEALLAHTRLHTGVKPFWCSVCNTSFSYQSSLINHIKTH